MAVAPFLKFPPSRILKPYVYITQINSQTSIPPKCLRAYRAGPGLSSPSQCFAQLARCSGDISDCLWYARSPTSVDHCPTSLVRAFHYAQTVTSLHRSHTSFAYSNLVASARIIGRNSRQTVDSASRCTVLTHACKSHQTAALEMQ